MEITMTKQIFCKRTVFEGKPCVMWSVERINEALKATLLANGFQGTLDQMKIRAFTQEECDVVNAKVKALIEAKVLIK